MKFFKGFLYALPYAVLLWLGIILCLVSVLVVLKP